MASAEDLRDRLNQVHDDARAAAEHQVAYHALAGVLHAAESLHDLEGLDRVQQQAGEYARWLEVNAPKHPLSPQSAARRGHHCIFDQLAATAAAARARIKSEKLNDQQKGRP